MVQIIKREDPEGLYIRYPNQFTPEKVYIYLDLQGGVMHADTGIFGGGKSDSVHHGLVRRYEIPTLTAEAANTVMEEIAPFADRILADWDGEWHGGNLRGVLGSDAQEAEEGIEMTLGYANHSSTYPWYDTFDPTDIVEEVDYSYTVNELAERGITANSSDKEVEELACRLVEEIKEDYPDRVVAVIGLPRHLRDLRDEMRDDEES